MIIFWTGLSLVLSALSLLPLWRTTRGWVRLWDFPKIQLASLQGMTLIALLASVAGGAGGWLGTAAPEWVMPLVATLGMATLLYLMRGMWPYCPWALRESEALRDGETPNLALYIANILQDNRDYARLLRQVDAAAADMVMLLETDAAWQEAMRPLEARYPHQVQAPLPNKYGMLLFSRLPLSQVTLRHLVEKDIPSIRAEVELGAGARLVFYGLHPRPPQPLNDADERNIELWVVAQEARLETLPVVVAGDMNDVGWSRTTRRFRETSGLKDPRLGRGLFNSFHALHWFLRWPLDHIFHSGAIRLGAIHRMPGIGSDHFPIFVRFHVPAQVSPRDEPAGKSAKEAAQAEVRALGREVADRTDDADTEDNLAAASSKRNIETLD